MKQHFLKIGFLTTFLAMTITTMGQVTIGSKIAPNTGSLLDLKQEDATTTGGATAKAGLALPRVKLTDLNNLYPMFEDDGSSGYKQGSTSYVKADEDAKHIGLIVYHSDKCTFKGKGPYVWTGTEWMPLHEYKPFVPTLSQTYFDLPSGVNQAIPVTQQNLTVTWAGNTSATWAIAAASGKTGVTFTSPITGITGSSNVGASPYTMTIMPAAMTVNAASPWQSNESQITFTNLDIDCQQNFVTLNQTNYALKVNDQFTNSQKVYTTAGTYNFPVQGNAAWKSSVSDLNGVLSSTTVVPATGGEDIKVTTTNPPSTTINYTTTAGSKYNTANITFSDTATVKRFKDITVSFVNCSTGNEPTMEQWAERAGFSQQDINDVKVGGGTVERGPKANGIMLHLDQSGNIFLSGSFGTTAGRWMLNNLAVKKFSDNVAYKGVNGKVLPHYSTVDTDDTYYVSAYSNPYYAYPNGGTRGATATTYINNPRLGLLYTWDAATAGKGGSNGQADINDGNNSTVPRVQGICPDGWHLPSDYEWTQLEQEIQTNTATYSSTPNIGGTITTPSATGITQSVAYLGFAMMDICPAPDMTALPRGTSNVISTALPAGTSLILAGFVLAGTTYNYGKVGASWSASGKGPLNAWVWYANDMGRLVREGGYRVSLHSVRCKKN